MSRARTLLFAVAGGAAVGNLYWAQPLLDFIARDLHTSPGTAAWLVTATQLGYAVGILLIVPLGDTLDRRRLVPVMLLCSAVALAACALAPSMPALLAAIAAVGLTTVAGQILIPLAGDLADDDTRGRVVGTVVSGVLIGILLSRTISGLIAEAAGWRAIYLLAAATAVLFAELLHRVIPSLPAKTRLRYPALIVSVGAVIARERVVRWTLALGACGFGAFTLFRTALTFLLSAPPYSYPVSVIGLFGLAGVAGALTAQRAGRLHDRGWSLPATGAAWAVALLTFVGVGLAPHSVVVVLVAVVTLDIALQALGVLNQTRLFAVSGVARSRLNTAFVTANFLGGAVGSAAAAQLWTAGGWTAVATAGAALSCLALSLWAVGRRRALALGPPADHRGPGHDPAR